LRRVLDLLRAHGFTPSDIQIDPEVMTDPVRSPDQPARLSVT
jgi:hypothetical protein